jgi:hypothetical protein
MGAFFLDTRSSLFLYSSHQKTDFINKCHWHGLLRYSHFTVTAIHSIAGNVVKAGKIPLPLDNEREAIEADLQKAAFPRVDGVGDVRQAEPVVGKKLHGTIRPHL